MVDVETQSASTPQHYGADVKHIATQLQPLAVKISELTADPKNARLHDDKNMDAIKSSMKRFGQRSPIVVQKEGMIVRAGNGRLEAAKALGWETIAAVVVDDDDLEATAYAVADNRTGELATWNWGELAEALILPNMSDVGFTTSEIEAIASISLWDGIDDDDVPKNPEFEKFYTAKIRFPAKHKEDIEKVLESLTKDFDNVEVS